MDISKTGDNRQKMENAENAQNAETQKTRKLPDIFFWWVKSPLFKTVCLEIHTVRFFLGNQMSTPTIIQKLVWAIF